MHRAPRGLLDFIDYLLEWSRELPILVVCLGASSCPASGPSAARRSRSSRSTWPRCGELLAGLVPGLPEDVAGRIVEQSEGIPLYAVETVLMLLDRGMLVREGARYAPTAAIGRLDVPESLQALAASRLDNLEPRRARAAAGRRRCSAFVHAGGAGRRQRPAGGGTRRASRVPGDAQFLARDDGETHRRGPVPLPAGTPAQRRAEHTLAACPAGTAPRRRGVPARRSRTAPASRRRSRRATCSTPSRSTRTPRTPTRFAPRRGSSSRSPANGLVRWPCPTPREATSSRPLTLRTTPRSARTCSPKRASRQPARGTRIRRTGCSARRSRA